MTHTDNTGENPDSSIGLDRAPANGLEKSGGTRMKFQGIVESAGSDNDRLVANPDNPAIPAIPVGPPQRNWNAVSRQVWQASRLGAILIFFAIAGGWPVGAYWSHMDRYGTSNGWLDTLFSTMNPSLVFFSIFVPIMILICGYLLSHAYKMLNAAQSIASAAREFIHPDHSAAYNVESVGMAVRGQMDALNTGVDGALQRLASVEAMIRNHVEAIETAGTAIETRATGAVDRVASERSRLIELTENLNTQADAFAAAIAERAQASIEAMSSAGDLSTKAETLLEERLTRLETAAARALQSFQALSAAIDGADENLRGSVDVIEASTEKAKTASEEAAKASQSAAESISQNAETISAKAIDTTTQEVTKLTDATTKALEGVKEKTQSALASAAEDTTKATAAIDKASEVASKASEAAAKASADITKASESVEKSAEEALTQTETASAKIDERNKILADARAALEKENTRLEALIEEQRSRADRLADAITAQTQRLSNLADAQLREQEATARLAEAQTAIEATKPAEPARQKAAPKPSTAVTSANSSVLDLGRAMRRKNKTKKAAAPKKSQSPNGDRLDQLAKDIAASRPAESKRKEPPISSQKTAAKDGKDKGDVSWREILDATDDAEPLDLAAASKTPIEANGAVQTEPDTASAIKIISELQSFTFNLETRLYGDPPPALRERFDSGDRNVFANRILRLNEADVKRRIRMESGRDRNFETGIHDFLQGFERLLEDATTSETADEDLEEYLSSPLGRVYLLIGATVGYFA